MRYVFTIFPNQIGVKCLELLSVEQLVGNVPAPNVPPAVVLEGQFHLAFVAYLVAVDACTRSDTCTFADEVYCPECLGIISKLYAGFGIVEQHFCIAEHHPVCFALFIVYNLIRSHKLLDVETSFRYVGRGKCTIFCCDGGVCSFVLVAQRTGRYDGSIGLDDALAHFNPVSLPRTKWVENRTKHARVFILEQVGWVGILDWVSTGVVHFQCTVAAILIFEFANKVCSGVGNATVVELKALRCIEVIKGSALVGCVESLGENLLFVGLALVEEEVLEVLRLVGFGRIEGVFARVDNLFCGSLGGFPIAFGLLCGYAD